MCRPGPRQPSNSRLARAGHYIRAHLNFYRIHILFFTFTPLIASAVLYASNGEIHISYIDALFNSVSAVTVCGLATVDLSSLTAWQQVILFLQMCVGSPVVVSWVMVYFRRSIFANQFREVVQVEISRRVQEKMHAPVDVIIEPWWKRLARSLIKPQLSTIAEATHSSDSTEDRGRTLAGRLRPDMIRRMSDAPKLINPSGYISEGHTPDPSAQGRSLSADPRSRESVALNREDIESTVHSVSVETELELARDIERDTDNSISGEKRVSPKLGDSSSDTEAEAEAEAEAGVPPSNLRNPVNEFRMRNLENHLPRTQTIEFALHHPPERNRGPSDGSRLERIDSRPGMRNRRASLPAHSPEDNGRSVSYARTMPRTGTMPRSGTLPRTNTTHTYQSMRTKHRNFGGFPMPYEVASRAVDHFFPNFKRTLTRTVTMPRTQTITSQAGLTPGAIPKPYISFDAVVGRNSAFESLTSEQMEELGGVEYRGLTALLWIVAGYHLGTQLLAYIVIAPYMSIPKWHEDFVPPMLHRPVAPAWFALFQVVSAYTNTGMSLEDQSMVPFQKAYPMIVLLIFLILAGNTAFPIFLRLTIWTISKIVPQGSRLYETLRFLLDHPRRCFIYLFPSHQTWFLLTVVIALNITDWFFFLVLDIGNPAIESIPVGVRVLLGVLQAAAVRAAGFGTVALSALAPAVKVLYVIMMYISVYPIAMSVRSTNVYEEKSLGVFREDDESVDEEEFTPSGNRATIWGRYLALHARKQLSFDMWWLGLALFLVCIVERGNLQKDENTSWFTIFTILFELVSAYGTVGLSLGVPYANFSFSGALNPLSKLIICAVMFRGRHRGLPVAIDRAVILPFEFREPHDHVDITVTDEGRAHNHSGLYQEKSPQELQRRSWRSGSPNSRGRTSRLNTTDSIV